MFGAARRKEKSKPGVSGGGFGGWREKVAEEGVDNVQGSGICKVKRPSFA